jgi:S-adenosylmethionine hydrolase
VSVITLTTDFGTGSPYVAAMKGVILSINPAVTLVDITHAIRPQDVRQGALVLSEVAEHFPAGTIHVVVVDPGVGTDRAIVCARIGSQCYVAPDNGLLARLARRTPPSLIVRVSEPCYWRHPVSATFHGRDVMAPVAAWLSLGLEPTRLGSSMARLTPLDWPEPVQTASRIEGQILEIDSFGNLITNITADIFASDCLDREAVVLYKGHQIVGIARTYADRPQGSRVALVGSSGRLELAVVGGSAAAEFSANIGEPVLVEWRPR